MNRPAYFHALEEIRLLSLSELKNTLSECPKKTLGDVTLAELCSIPEYPNGLYLFFDHLNEPWYVGKSTSRSFIERVPSHFDTREEAWFNTLPKKIVDVCQVAEYKDAHALGLTLKLVLIGVKSKQTAINLEGALRDYLQPQLNKVKKRRCTGSELVSSYEA